MKSQKNYEQISKKVFQLSPDKRAHLAKKIIESLEPGADPDVEIAWQQEVARRIQQIDQDQVTLIPFEEVRKRIKGS